MNFTDAREYALEFWTQPEFTPFPANVQDKLLASYRADLKHIGAMSVVYNGLLAVDTEYIDVAEDILRSIQLDEARTGDAMMIVKDICYLGLFRALIDPRFRNRFGTDPKTAFKASIETRERLASKDDFHAGEAAGVISEALTIFLLNEAGFETVPSFPWEDQPHNSNMPDYNSGFDAYVLTDGVSKRKVQVKSSLAMPPSRLCEDEKKAWGELDLETKRKIMVQSYAPDIAVLVLETDLGIAPEYQHQYFKSLASKASGESNAWKLQAMDVITEAVW